MKRIFRKLLLAISSVVMLFVLCGCSCEGAAEKPSDENKNELSLNKTSLSLIVGERTETALFPVYDGTLDGYTFSSANEEIAVVDELGFVTGIGEGTTTVSFGKGTHSADCTVSVSANGMIPVLYFENELGGEKTNALISLTDECNLRAKVKFNGILYDDLNVEYTVADETVGSVEDGVFKPKKKGTTQVTLTASWRNFNDEISKEALSCVVTITVKDEIRLYVNQTNEDAFTIYTLDRFAGENYPTETAFVATCWKNGATATDIKVNVELLDGEDYVEYDSSAQTFSAKKFGSAKIKLSCVVDGEKYERTVVVKVERPIAEYSETLSLFSAVDGLVNVQQSEGYVKKLVGDLVLSQEDGAIYDAYLKTGEPLTVKDGKILGVPTRQTSITETELLIGTETVRYSVKIKGYTKVLTEAKDFDSLAAEAGVVKTGYYILMNDVDMAGHTIAHQLPDYQSASIGYSGMTALSLEKVEPYGFGGVFDGQGHVIRNLTLGTSTQADLSKKATDYNLNLKQQELLNGGLFGYLRGTAEDPFEIKNFALVNVTANGAPIFALACQGETKNDGNRVHDIYIEVNPESVRLHGLYTVMDDECMRTLTENVVLSYPVAESDLYVKDGGLKWQGGTLAYCSYRFIAGYVTDMPANFQNVNMISGSPVSLRWENASTPMGKNQYVVYAANQTPAGELTTGKKNVTGYAQLSTVYSYQTSEQFADDVAARWKKFDSSVWKMVNGVPTFRALAADVSVDGERIDGATPIDAYLKHGNEKQIESVMPQGGTFVGYRSSDENVLTIDENGRVTIKETTEVKEAYVTLEYTFAGETFEERINFHIVPEIITIDTEFEFSALDGVLPYEALGLTDIEILSAKQGDRELSVTQDGRVLDVKVSILADKSGVGFVELLLETENFTYRLTKVKAYSKIIETAEDLAVLDIVTADYRLDGYYVLKNNIDLEGATFWHKGVYDTTERKEIDSDGGFYGIFEGNGYTISNLKATYCGLFGRIGEGAIVRNLGVANVDVTGVKGFSTGIGGVGLAYRIKGESEAKTLLDNVYIHIDPNDVNAMRSSLYGAIAFYQSNEHVSYRNVIVEYDPLVDASIKSQDKGTLFMYDSETDETRNGTNAITKRTDTMQEVYVISPIVNLIEWRTAEPTAENPEGVYAYRYYAENEGKTESANDGIYVYKNVRRYDTFADFSADSDKSTSGFNASYWDFSGNGPTWKSAPVASEPAEE